MIVTVVRHAPRRAVRQLQGFHSLDLVAGRPHLGGGFASSQTKPRTCWPSIGWMPKCEKPGPATTNSLSFDSDALNWYRADTGNSGQVSGTSDCAAGAVNCFYRTGANAREMKFAASLRPPIRVQSYNV